jgi:hypothetical protein
MARTAIPAPAFAFSSLELAFVNVLIVLLFATAPRCGDRAATLESLISSNLPPAKLRLEVGVALGAARSDLSGFPGNRLVLDPIFQGFARRISEVSDSALATEVADVATSLLEVCRRAENAPPGLPAAIERSRLQGILARSEFDLQDEPVGVLDRVWRWLRKVVLSLLEARGTAAYGEAGRYVILSLGVVGALLVTYRVIRVRRGAFRSKPPSKELHARTLDSPDTHLLRAREAEARGDSRGALREQMLAILATLERQHLAAPGRARTNREIAAEAVERGASAETASQLKDLADWYDQAWYGLANVTLAEVADFSSRAQRLRSGAEQPTR